MRLLILLAVSAMSVLQPVPPRLFEVPNHGRLRVVIPLEWRVSFKSVSQPSAVRVHIVPATGTAFDIQLTTVWLDTAARAKATPDNIKANVRRSADSLLRQSENKSVIMEDLRGEDVSGNYFTLADDHPAPGDYRYVTQGTFLTGELLTAFTILHNMPESTDLARALRMLGGTRHVP